VTFMLRVRNGENFASGITVTGFWLGLTVGRVILGFVTGQIGEKLAIVIYLLMSMALELLFWLIPSFISSAIFAALLGFFLSNLFPAAIVVTTKLLPKHLHLSSVGFAAAFGGGGAALFPFAVGAIAQAKGVEVLQPIALALIIAILVVWCVLPGGFKKGGLELAQIERVEAKDGREMMGKVTKFRRKLGLIL
jgi:fucose permease